MESLKIKYEKLEKAFVFLKKAITIFSDDKQAYERDSTQTYLDRFETARDSLIQRFEYCTDMFWKFMKNYLEQSEKITLESKSPKGVVRTMVNVGTFSEQEGDQLMHMLDCRNVTSHV